MLDEIERLVSEVRGVCAGIAHDLRTPMTHLRGGLERVRRRSYSADHYADAIDTAIGQSDGAQSFHRAAADRGDRSRRTVRERRRVLARHRIARCDRTRRAACRSPELSLTVHAPVPVEVFGNIDLLSGAIENLFDTALKFTPAGGAVALDLGREAGAAVLQVIDTGPGIDPGEREAVLRPFYRSAGEQVRMTAGQGLGLSLVGAIARMHGADLEIHDNRPGLQDAAAIREPVMTQPRDSGGRRPTLRHNSFVISPLPVQA
jgi:signal transduction histidine kinase